MDYRTIMRNSILLIATLLLSNALVGSISGAPLYQFTDLGDLPGGADNSAAFGINSLGQVVGSSATTAIVDGAVVARGHAFVWTSGAGMQDLGAGAGDLSEATGINASGQIVGSYYTHAPISGDAIGSHAVLWTGSGGFQELGHLPGDDSSNGSAINVHGQVAGDSRVFSAQGSIDRAFIWSASDGMQYLGDLPGGTDVSYARGINDNGQVVGTSSATGGSRAFLWTKEAGMQNLGGLLGGSGFSSGTGISNSGAVIGYATPQGGGSHAFLWRNGIGMQDLGDLPSGDNMSVALGVNTNNDVVGQSSVAFGSGTSIGHAFVWTQSAGMMDLNNLVDSSAAGWTLIVATDINDAGQIVGSARTPNGVNHAFLLTPVPEPTAICLAVMSVFCFGILLIRKFAFE
jgi:probable HAF family extracellular repeat protein